MIDWYLINTHHFVWGQSFTFLIFWTVFPELNLLTMFSHISCAWLTNKFCHMRSIFSFLDDSDNLNVLTFVLKLTDWNWTWWLELTQFSRIFMLNFRITIKRKIWNCAHKTYVNILHLFWHFLSSFGSKEKQKENNSAKPS